MKKVVIKRIIMTIVFMTIFSLFSNVKALYNSSAGTSFNGQYTGNCNGQKNCLLTSFNNGSVIMQARLYYIDNASFQQIGETIYFVNSVANNNLNNSELNLVYLSSLNSCTADKYECAKIEINKFIGSNTGDITLNGKNLLNSITGVEDYNEVLRLESKKSSRTKGYRLMLEPAKLYVNPSFSNDNAALITEKGLAIEALKNNNPNLKIDNDGQTIVVDKNDVGIEAISKNTCKNISTAQISDIKNGCGYSLLDISQYINVSCYGMNIDEKTLNCLKSDENNIIKFEETYSKLNSCSNASAQDITSAGKLYHTSGVCKIYCKETAELSLPGNVLNAKIKGTYFAWPTRSDDKTGIYPMSMKSSLKCKIVDLGGTGESVAATVIRKCSGGYTEMDNNTCRSNNKTKDATCQNDSVSDGETKNTCTKTIDTKDKICPSGTKADSQGLCRKISGYKCSSGTYDSTYQTCKKAKVEQFTKTCNSGTYYEGSGQKYCWIYKGISHYTCPANHIREGTNCYTSRPIYFYCNDNSHQLVGSMCYYSSTLKNVYTYKTTTNGCGSGWTQDAKNCSYHGGSIVCTYSCKKFSYSYRDCPSGGTVVSQNDTRCKYNAPWTQRECPDGYTTAASSSADYDHACYKKGTPVYESCPSGWKNPGSSLYWCEHDPIKEKVCPSGFSTDLGNGYCGNTSYIVDPIYNGDIVDKVCPSGYTERNGKCYIFQTVNKVCSSGEILIAGKCYKIIEKTKLEYICPEGYEKDGTTCKKICSLDTLKESVKSQLENSKMRAKLTGGTNNLFGDYLAQEKTQITETVDKNNSKIVTYTRKTNFYIPNHVNRYYNQLTGVVSNVYNATFYDRKEGVVSTSFKDETNKKYNLTISNIEIGVGNKFGSKITGEYTCTYKLIDNPIGEPNDSCVCPSGTDNVGDKISDLVELCDNPEAKNYKYTCAELQHILCNKIEPKNSPFVCKKQYTCRGNKNVEITSCVDLERKNGKSLEKAIIECTEQNDKCNGNYCYNDKNELQDLTLCLDRGNSKTTCMKKNGCLSNSCLGSCTESLVEGEAVILKYNKCINNGKKTICSPMYSCKNINKKLSPSASECINNKLNMSITDALTNGVDTNKIKSALNACKETACIPKDSPIVVYRIIDLKNPFPLNNQKPSTLNISFDNKKSRNPGSNWNGNTLINNEILNAREKSNYDLYNSEPLYKITLTPEIIKKIKQSNKSYTYGNIICNDNSLCISNFLHSELKIEAKNDCKNLGTNSTREEYNSCYNSKD